MERWHRALSLSALSQPFVLHRRGGGRWTSENDRQIDANHRGQFGKRSAFCAYFACATHTATLTENDENQEMGSK